VIPLTGRLVYPKEARIRRRGEFLALQRQGRRRHTPHLVVIRHPAKGPISRLGVTVSGRVGNSVVRNRVKRLIRELFRQCRADLVPPEDVLIIAKSGADTLTYAQVATEFAQAIHPAPRS
jgi:ribonuclease P protein component